MLLGFCQVRAVLGRLGCVVVRLRKCLTFWMPSLITCLSQTWRTAIKIWLACLPQEVEAGALSLQPGGFVLV